MNDYLQQQQYSSLGYIYDHAVANEIEWLKNSVQDKVKYKIADLITDDIVINLS